jgi:hypothetical protein
MLEGVELWYRGLVSGLFRDSGTEARDSRFLLALGRAITPDLRGDIGLMYPYEPSLWVRPIHPVGHLDDWMGPVV